MAVSLTLDIRTPDGGTLPNGGLVTVRYDRTVSASGMITPDPAGDSLVISQATDPVVVIPYASDDPAVDPASQGYGLIVTARWRQGADLQSWTKTYGLTLADGATPKLSDLGLLVPASTPNLVQGPRGPVGPGQTNAGVASFVTTPGDTQTALDGRYTQPSGVVSEINTSRGLSSTNYVTVGETNSTSHIQSLLNDAYNSGGSLRQAKVAPGVYIVEGLVMPDLVTLEAENDGSSRYSSQSTSPTYRYGAVTFSRPNGSTSTSPIIMQSGSGSGLRGITLAGNNAGNAPALVSQGFETLLDGVRIISQPGTAWDVQKANNPRWHDIYIDHCGSTTQAAVTFRSVQGVGLATATNGVMMSRLTIEEAPGTSLQIGVGGTTADYWAEFVTFSELHIESRYPGNVWTTSPIISVGACRGITFDNAFIVGGPGYLLEHNHPVAAAQAAYSNSGILIHGGDWIGSDTTQTPTPPAATPYAIHLVNGNDFRMIATRFGRITTANVQIESTYGANAYVDPSATSTNGNTAQMVADSRAKPTRRVRHGEEITDRHLYQRVQYAPAPTVALYAANGGGPTPTISGTDTNCRVSFGTGASPSAGAQVQLKFGTAFDGQENIQLTPTNALSAASQAYVISSNDGTFAQICLPTPTASAAAGAYSFNVWVVGN